MDRKCLVCQAPLPSWQSLRKLTCSSKCNAQWKLRPQVRGMTPKQLERLGNLHQGKCPICRTREATQVSRTPRSKAVRGMLCAWCVKGLAFFAESPARLLAAVEFLQSHQRLVEKTLPELNQG